MTAQLLESMVNQTRPPLTLQKREKGLADVISIHELVTNQILLFKPVATPWLWIYYLWVQCTSAVVGLQINQAMNGEC